MVCLRLLPSNRIARVGLVLLCKRFSTEIGFQFDNSALSRTLRKTISYLRLRLFHKTLQ